MLAWLNARYVVHEKTNDSSSGNCGTVFRHGARKHNVSPFIAEDLTRCVSSAVTAAKFGTGFGLTKTNYECPFGNHVVRLEDVVPLWMLGLELSDTQG